MESFYTEYLETLGALHAELKAMLHGLPPEGLDWAPAGDANALAVLVAHVAGSQTYWLGDVLSGRPSRRDRDAEFATQQIDELTLGARLDAAMEDTARIVASLSVENLAEDRLSPRHQRMYTVAWVLFHALEHTAQHVGHAQLTRQLWDQRVAA